ncbi:peptidyl-tRNA hydrolase domain protein [Metarhizium acridum CQMa 102]|uniref:Peptidyl-tRNA hydrolase domain protein n=1 Tax=Metarhizium acridum (strain CQMa 102) TaxID=655827 RepID=E9E5S4_METAQ|nr:peptidyl-tRNA hydrolase domain protein [Metarhizium acridum CQMa 102]EFY88787.1 peptidyl-tRNA hydrolase domain protein [Metarhizium acridum CQMa 102]
MNMFRLPRRIPRTHLLATLSRPFTLTAPQSKNLPPRPKPPPDCEIEESFLKGSGPGGQKINKTNSAVQLKHVPTGIVVKSQATRSRSQNRKHARELLAQKVDDLLHGEQSRSSIVGQFKKKKAASAAKKSRRKYRKLDEEREERGAAGGQGEPQQQLPPHELDSSSQVERETVVEETRRPQEKNKQP